jgi:hypothetical protein
MRQELSALRDDELFMSGIDIVLDAAESAAKAGEAKSSNA